MMKLISIYLKGEDHRVEKKSVGQEAHLVLCGYEVDVNLASH